MARALTAEHTFTAALAPETMNMDEGGKHTRFVAWLSWAGAAGTETVAISQQAHSSDATYFPVDFSPFGAGAGNDTVRFEGLSHRVRLVTGGVWNPGATLHVRITAFNEGDEMPLTTGTRTLVP